MAQPSQHTGPSRHGTRVGEELQHVAHSLEERSGVGSATSEGRDDLQEGERIQEELERRSSTSSSSSRKRRGRTERSPSQEIIQVENSSDVGSAASSEGTTNSARAVYRGMQALWQPDGAAASSGSGQAAALSRDKPMLDTLELAISEAKRAAMERGEPVGSGSSSNVDSGISGGGGSGSGSHLGSRSATTFGLGSSNTSSGQVLSSVPPMVLPAHVMGQLDEEKREMIESVMAKVVRKTGQDLAELQAALDKSKQNVTVAHEDKSELEVKVAKLQAKAAINENLSDALVKSRQQKIGVEEERDDLQDKLAGMEARLNAKIDRHEKEKEELKHDKQKEEEQVREKTAMEKARLEEELKAAAKEMERAKKQRITATLECDAIRRSEVVAEELKRAEMNAMESELNAARRELERTKKESGMKSKSPWDDFEEQRQLEEKLKEQRDSNLRLGQDLTDLRLAMLQVQKAKDDELADLKAKVEVNHLLPGGRPTKQGRPGVGGRKVGAGKAGGSAMKLTCIDEEGDGDDLSQAGSGISGQVSSSGDVVGNLLDFDEDEERIRRMWSCSTSDGVEVQSLREQLANAQSWYKHLNDEKKAKEAEHKAKIHRLSQQVVVFRDEAVASRDETDRLRTVIEEVGAEKHAEVAQVKQKLIAQQSGKDAADGRSKVPELESQVRLYASQLEEVRQQLTFAIESKRLMSVRLEDTKRELEATEQRHARTVEDLNARLMLSGVTGDAEEVANSVWMRLQAMEEERNVLRNELECQRVHWQAKFENEQYQYAVVVAKLREEEAMAEKDRELKNQVEESLKEKQRLLKAAQQALKEAEDRAQQEAARAAAARAGSAAGPAWLGILRCPSRSQPAPVGGAMLSAGQGRGEVVACQAIVWQIISSMSGVTALLCAEASLKILDASKKAFTMWGSAALRGSSLVKLVFDQATASWLQAEMSAPAEHSTFLEKSPVEGYWHRELGCVEFRSKLGSAFDSSVTCARLPEEPQRGRAPVIIVIVEPLEVEQQQQHHRTRQQHIPHRGAHRPGARSTTSSVHSEDITANDSVSNVNAKW